MCPASDLFQTYLKSPTKCWPRASGEPGIGHLYPEWVRSRNESFASFEVVL